MLWIWPVNMLHLRPKLFVRSTKRGLQNEAFLSRINSNFFLKFKKLIDIQWIVGKNLKFSCKNCIIFTCWFSGMGKPYGTEGIVVWFGFYMQVILFLLCMFSIACSIYPSSLITLHYIENYFPKQGTEQMPSFIICSSVFKVSHDSFCPGCVL